MKPKSPRSPRTTGSHLDFDGVHMFGWPPLNRDTPAFKKLSMRLRNKLCLGCGEKQCRCKSAGDWRELAKVKNKNEKFKG